MQLYQGDCLEVMKQIPDKSVDMILCDLPYGTTACKWDIVIPFDALWNEYNRIIKDNGAICLFGSEPFSSKMRLSNIKMFHYDWIWEKTLASNFAMCKKQPFKKHEIISVFYKQQPTYNPQFEKGKPYKDIRPRTYRTSVSVGTTINLQEIQLLMKAHVIRQVFKNSVTGIIKMCIQHKSLFHYLNIL